MNLGRDLRLRHPDGSFDDGGRFYPSEKEVRDCCADIRAPSRTFPFSLMKHCRTAKYFDYCAFVRHNVRHEDCYGARSAASLE
jgi:hypothetical protein